jgi:hypothetical protein
MIVEGILRVVLKSRLSLQVSRLNPEVFEYSTTTADRY